MKKVITLGTITIFTIALAGCASLKNHPKKAPCSPTASLVDPCGDAKPINGVHSASLSQKRLFDL